MSVKHLYLIAVAAILGCASAGTSGTSGTSGGAPRRGNLITAEDITAAHADVSSVYDAIARLRPNWLATHGPTSLSTAGGAGVATVWLNGVQYGDLGSLRNIPAYDVADIRYYDVTEAGARYGLKGGTSGVIEVRTRTR
jgi:hypothetical protein